MGKGPGASYCHGTKMFTVQCTVSLYTVHFTVNTAQCTLDSKMSLLLTRKVGPQLR